jgi:hypothetical protein
MRVHLAFLQSPMFGQNPAIAQMFVPAIVSHIKDHLLMHYMKMTRQGLAAANESGILGEDDAMQEAQAAVEIQQAIEQAIPPEFLEIMAKAFEQAQSLQPPMPQDPTMAAVEVQKQMIQQRAASDQMKIEANQQHDQLQAQQAQQKLEADALEQQQKDAAAERKQARQEQVDILLETLRQDREDQRKQAEIAAKLQVNADDNETAKQLAAAEILSGERLAMTTSNNINPLKDSIYWRNSLISTHKYSMDQKKQKNSTRNTYHTCSGIGRIEYFEMSIDNRSYQSKVW